MPSKTFALFKDSPRLRKGIYILSFFYLSLCCGFFIYSYFTAPKTEVFQDLLNIFDKLEQSLEKGPINDIILTDDDECLKGWEEVNLGHWPGINNGCGC